MKRIIPYLLQLTIIFSALVLSSPKAWSSLSVFTEGNPRSYGLLKSKSSIEVYKSGLYFEGADMKKAYFLFSKDDDSEGILCEKTKLDTADGRFICDGYLKKGKVKTQIRFPFHLEPIKDGFILKTKIEKPMIELNLTFKKK